jgi:hypothetical protein
VDARSVTSREEALALVCPKCGATRSTTPLSTTLGIYGHRDRGDLERDMEAFARWRREDADFGIVPANDPEDPHG